MPSRLNRLFAHTVALLATLFVAACGKAEEKQGSSGPSSVWRVEKDGKYIYVGGTIHLLRKEDHPLPAVFTQAYADSTRLVFELPPDSDTDARVVELMRQMGSYPGAETIADHVKPATLEMINEWADASGYPRAMLHKLRTWCLALTVAAVEYGKLGADPQRGVDAHFEALAKKDGKPAEGLETVEFQLGIFGGLSDKLQEELLLQTFTEAKSVAKDFAELISAWRAGDSQRLQEFLFRDAEKYPELMEDFLFKRNRAWIPPLLKHLEKGEKAYVLVGAGHLGGDQGILELLKKQGCTITQLGVSAKAPASR